MTQVQQLQAKHQQEAGQQVYPIDDLFYNDQKEEVHQGVQEEYQETCQNSDHDYY